MSRPLSQCLDSLSSYHLNSYYNSSPPLWDWWAYSFMQRLNGIDHVMGKQEFFEGRNRVCPVAGMWWICLANHVLQVFTGRCHILGQGRLISAWMIGAWLR